MPSPPVKPDPLKYAPHTKALGARPPGLARAAHAKRVAAMTSTLANWKYMAKLFSLPCTSMRHVFHSAHSKLTAMAMPTCAPTLGSSGS